MGGDRLGRGTARHETPGGMSWVALGWSDEARWPPTGPLVQRASPKNKTLPTTIRRGLISKVYECHVGLCGSTVPSAESPSSRGREISGPKKGRGTASEAWRYKAYRAEATANPHSLADLYTKSFMNSRRCTAQCTSGCGQGVHRLEWLLRLLLLALTVAIPQKSERGNSTRETKQALAAGLWHQSSQ